MLRPLLFTPLNFTRPKIPNRKKEIMYKHIIKNYCWFLKATDKSNKDLVKWISDPRNKREAENRADVFGDSFYDVIEHIGGKKTLRYLVI
jgi:hypothetical protein